MEQDLFTYLPPELTINILLRLPVRTAASCKCVRKSWQSLIETSYKSVPSLAVFEGETSSIPYKVYELEDEINLENFKNPCKVVFNFSLPQPKFLHSSANGLLFFTDISTEAKNLAICNPVTREYINLPDPFVPTRKWQFQLDALGFGVSKTTGQYKLVRVFKEGYDNSETREERPMYWIEKEFHCQVYTLGTGLWRNTAHGISLNYVADSVGVLLNGNIHWLAYDLRLSPWISYCDLETELFSTFFPPHLDAICHDGRGRGREATYRTLFVLRDCLGLCDNTDKLVLWLMNTYGDGKSWTKHFVLAPETTPLSVFAESLFVLKEFKDGEIMMKRRYGIICCCSCSIKTNTIQRTNLIQSWERNSAVCYTQSFFRLKTFAMENVSSF